MTKQSTATELMAALQKSVVVIQKLEKTVAGYHEPIAIIGMGCHYPGDANTPAQFWENLRNGRDGIRELPHDRAMREHQGLATGPTSAFADYIHRGGFLAQVDQFDAAFFGFSPYEVSVMDPAHRLLLETTWAALEDANVVPAALFNTEVGVFIGGGASGYNKFCVKEAGNLHVATGNAVSTAAGRLSYWLGITGPCLSVDTACSSSLTAVHLACQSLRNGECTAAIAGGVNLMLDPDVTMLFAGYMLSPDTQCKTFDAAADGYVRGEGCGIVVLKRLSDALAAGDPIMAVIRGTAVNQDGPSGGLTVPNGPSQARVIRRALEDAKVKPAQISYVEAHGTGTPLGDPIEIGALSEVFKDRAQPLYVGSVKTNVGHLEFAAGIAGLMKVVLALHHGEIPPHLHLQQPNPHIDWAATPVQVPTTVMPWPQETETTAAVPSERIAGLSSFGLSGTNAHLIIAEAPTAQALDRLFTRSHPLLTLSAKSEQALRGQAQAYLDFFADQPTIDLENVCHTTHVGRSHFAHRLSITAESVAQMQTSLAAYLNGQIEANVSQGVVDSSPSAPKVAFLFTGQGAQYLHMGRMLYATQPVFRQVLDRCEAVAQECLGRSLLELLYPATPPTHNDLLKSQPCGQAANFALECALADLWRSWGVTPDLVLGHSLGDFAAAYTAGVFSLEAGLRLVMLRGRLMETAVGKMVSVLASEAEVAPFVAAYPRVAIAVLNGPESVVISGEEGAITTITAQLQGAGFKTRVLAIPVATHSPLLDPVLVDFEKAVRAVALAQPTLPVVSSMTGQFVTHELTTPAYWRQHLRQPVRFAAGVQTLIEQGCTLFVEIGPKPTLLGLVEAILDSAPVRGPVQRQPGLLPSLRENYADWEQMSASLGALYVHGYPIDWPAVDQGYATAKVRLPTYAFQRQSYWVEPQSAAVLPPTGQNAGQRAQLASASERHAMTNGAVDGTPHGAHSQPNGKLPGSAQLPLPPRPVAPSRPPASPAKLSTAGVERLLQQQLQTTQRVISEQLAFLRGPQAPLTAKQPVKPPPVAKTPPVPVAPTTPSPAAPLNPMVDAVLRLAQPGQLPVTAAQHQLWLLSQITPQGALAYNERLLVQFDGLLNVAALQQAFQQVVDRHEALRTTFSADGQWQAIQPSLAIELPVHALAATDVAAWLDVESRQPFDFTNGPLLRATLLQLAPQQQLLVLTAHHIIVDGISLSIMVDELITFYAALAQGQTAVLPRAQQFRDYAQWQADQEHSAEFQAQAAYWLAQLNGALPVLTLPADHPYPPLKSYQGGRHTRTIEAALAQALKRNGQQQGCTTFMILLAAYMAFLHRLTGQDDLLVGIPTAGRGLAGSESVVGYCTHLLPIRSRLGGDQLSGAATFTDYLRYLKRELLDAYEHSDYPYAKLLDRLHIVHEASRTPLLSTTFNLDKPTPTVPMAGLTLSFPPAPRPFVHFDLALNIIETPDQWVMEWNYNTDILEPATVERWLGHFMTFLTAIVANPSQKVSHLALLSPAERQQLLVDWNDTVVAYPQDQCIHHLFEAQAARTPDAVAVILAEDQRPEIGLQSPVSSLSPTANSMNAPTNWRIICKA